MVNRSLELNLHWLVRIVDGKGDFEFEQAVAVRRLLRPEECHLPQADVRRIRRKFVLSRLVLAIIDQFLKNSLAECGFIFAFEIFFANFYDRFDLF